MMVSKKCPCPRRIPGVREFLHLELKNVSSPSLLNMEKNSGHKKC